MELEELDTHYPLGAEQIAFYRDNGYIHLNSVLSPSLLEWFRPCIRAAVEKNCANRLPLEKRSTYDKAFLQVMNIWTKDEQVRQFVFGKRLARIATELM